MTLRLRDDDLKWRELEGEVVALDLQQSEYFGVNRTGSVLWKAIAGGATHGELVDLLVERYRLDDAEAARHVDEFAADLRRRGLLEHS